MHTDGQMVHEDFRLYSGHCSFRKLIGQIQLGASQPLGVPSFSEGRGLACPVPFLCCAQLHLPLGDPVDCSRPGSSVHGILQARILEWVAISFSRASSCIPGKFFRVDLHCSLKLSVAHITECLTKMEPVYVRAPVDNILKPFPQQL